MVDSRIIVALDFPAEADALKPVSALDPGACKLKVGKELFVAAGPAFVQRLEEKGFQVFLDLKFHDIPNTVAAACKAAARLGVWMLNVHALGGRAMLLAAREALDTTPRPLLIGVTLLTSFAQRDALEVGLSGTVEDSVLRLARVSQECNLDGVVCSAREARALRSHCGYPFLLVTPGIRLPESAKDDQTRIVTPREAIADGADYLVIGRPITRAKDPARALAEITRSIATETDET